MSSISLEFTTHILWSEPPQAERYNQRYKWHFTACTGIHYKTRLPAHVWERKMCCVWATLDESKSRADRDGEWLWFRKVADAWWKRAGLFVTAFSARGGLSEEVIYFSSRNGKWRVMWREPCWNYTGDCEGAEVSRDYSLPLSAVLISRRELLLDVSHPK